MSSSYIPLQQPTSSKHTTGNNQDTNNDNVSDAGSPRHTNAQTHRYSHDSHDSNDSLTALEYAHGPMLGARNNAHGIVSLQNDDEDDDDEDEDGHDDTEGVAMIPRPTGRRDRAYSVSGFDFQHDLLPLAASMSDPDAVRGDGPYGEKNLGVVGGIALIIGLQVGSGIFSSPGVIVANTNSVGASLSVWLCSGLLAWTGASSFAELGSAIPLNGGAQAYLAYAYGPLVSYLFAWTAIIALKPGSNAVIALIFGEYVNRIFWHATSTSVSPDSIPQWAIKLTAVVAVLFVSLLCVATSKLGSRAAVAFTTVKIGCLLAITLIGLIQLARHRTSPALFSAPLFQDSSTSPSKYALALYSGLWAFDGWDQANYVGGEMRNAERNIPRAIHSSMVVVTVLFLLVNLSYFVVLDKITVSLSNTVAMDFGRAVFGGPVGGTIFACMVAFSCFGSLNGSFYTSSRLIYAAGRERYIPRIFGKLHSKRKTPMNATLLQSALTVGFILVGGGFRSLINFAVVASWAFYFLTVLGLVVLRVKEPMLERPYKTWIITPLTFCAVAIFLLCMPVFASPVEAIAVLAFVLAGIPVYYLTQKREDEVPRVFAWIGTCIGSIRGLVSGGRRQAQGEGWEAVRGSNDEGTPDGRGRGMEMEMAQTRR